MTFFLLPIQSTSASSQDVLQPPRFNQLAKLFLEGLHEIGVDTSETGHSADDIRCEAVLIDVVLGYGLHDLTHVQHDRNETVIDPSALTDLSSCATSSTRTS